MTVKKDNSGLVYSTAFGRMCPSCGAPYEQCICKRNQSNKHGGDGIVRVKREIKGRKGKTVTTITGIPWNKPQLEKTASELKKQLGTGGSCKEGVIIIQGDHRKQVARLLQTKGFTVKQAGG